MVIDRFEDEFIVEDPPPELVAALGTSRHVLRADSGGGSRIDVECARLDRDFGPSSGGIARIAIPCCLRELVALKLRESGLVVHDLGAGDPLPEPVAAKPANLRVVDRPMIDFVRSRESGLLHLGKQVNPIFLIAQIAAAWPGLLIAVVVTRREDVDGVARELGRYGLSAGRYTSHASREGPVQIAVGTELGMGDPAARFHERRLLLFPDAMDALGVRARFPLGFSRHARRFGFLLDGPASASLDRDQLRAAFGFEECFVPAHGQRLRDVEVDFRTYDGRPAIPDHPSLARHLRAGIWHNEARTRIVANLARSNLAKYASHPDPTAAPTTRARVAVLAANLEHAMALFNRLEGWSIAAANHADLDGLPQGDRALVEVHDEVAEGHGIIVTPSAIDGWFLGDLDVLIRADGGAGLPPKLCGIAVPNELTSSPLRVIDLVDRRSAELRRRSRSRREAYRLRGWTVDGVKPPTPLDHFLATRPGGFR
ncbi:hypothetical protein EP7_002006 [Isosphaeraceae bacterium EP7]